MDFSISNPSLFLIDASSYIFRAHHALPPMHNPQGKATSALYGFVRSVLKLCDDFKPTHIAAVFDTPTGKNQRLALYPQYKANRKEIPPELPEQIQACKSFCELYGICCLESPSHEADDLIAATALWGAKNNFNVYICSSDKDLFQLVNDSIFILETHKENRIIDKNGVREKFGVFPSQIHDYLALIGDSSDNIPGVKGIGPKSALALLEEFSSLNAILEKSATIKAPRLKALIEADKANALLSFELVRLETNSLLSTEAAFYTLCVKDHTKLREFYKEMGFRNLFSQEIEKAVPSNPFLLISPNEAMPALALAAEIGVSYTQESICCTFGNTVLVTTPEIFDLLPATPIICHDTKTLATSTHAHTFVFDTMLASYVLFAHEKDHSFESLVHTHLHTELRSLCAVELVSHASCLFALRDVLFALLNERALWDLYAKIELPLATVLARIQKNGVFVSKTVLSELSKSIHSELEILEKKIFDHAGEPFTLNSPKQLAVILFEKLQLPHKKKTKTGYSTDAEVLESLIEAHPIIALLLEYRQLEKLRSTYIDALPKEINPNTDRVHATLEQTITATGRLSCTKPNLQNIPIRHERGKAIRTAFCAQDSTWSIASFDYSQIELRLLAHMSQDDVLCAAFERGVDVHRYTASLIFNKLFDQVTDEERSRAKAVNFGLIYGQQAFGLARGVHISVKEAAQFIDTYFQRYPKVKPFLEGLKRFAKEHKKAKTLFGRERSIFEIDAKNPLIRAQAERLAINTPLQGSAADIIKMAMISIDQKLREKNLRSKMILQIHDELLFEVPPEEVTSLTEWVRAEMETVVTLRIPLTVNVNIGKNWGEC